MSVLMTVWTVIVSLVGLLWLSRHREISRSSRTQPKLSSRSYDGPPSPAPPISVLVAAKDEEATIGDCVRSLLDQDYPDYELIVINDRSTDRTGQILDDLARESPEGKLKIVTVKTLRAGWFGKNNAMREGVAIAGADWFCFADADCRQTSRRTLSMAVREAVENDVDFLSVLPVLETQSFWECLLQPVCSAIMLVWFNPRKVNDPNSPVAYANGAFMLMRRDCYRQIGTHDRVKTEVNEDMHMARFAKQAGLTLRVTQNEDLYVVRMYASFAETWRGWARIFYGCFGSLQRLLLSLVLLLVASILPWASLAIGVIGGLTAEPADAGKWWTLAFAALCAGALQQSVTFRLYGLFRLHPAWALGYPFGACLSVGILINAMMKLGGATRTVWRGTVYRGHQLDDPASGKTQESRNHA
jgi:glycosyltransferase involved in cell wall biosynthesis